jgi:hypothetical protein
MFSNNIRFGRFMHFSPEQARLWCMTQRIEKGRIYVAVQRVPYE